jgi:predicted phage tail protein
MTDKIIRGSGGPPPTPPSPTRAPDTLNSRQFATIQDLLSEGEIEGFATPSKAGLTKGTTAYNNAALKDIFLNDTPILNSSASNTSPQTSDFNFQNVGFTPRFGTSNQEHIPGIESSQSTTAVGVTVTNSSPVTRQITNTNVDAVKVTITFPQLQRATDEGDLLGSSVQLKIQIQYNGGGFNDAFSPDTITGRTADAYQKEYRVNLTGAFPVDIRVVRITADSTSSNLVDAFTWTSLGEIVDDKQRYLNSAYTNLRIDSEQFSSIPKRAFRIRGVKVRIPGAGASNSGTPTVDLQTGRIIYPSGYIFNGTMGAAVWCSCPAMVLLDLLTTERYGFGTHITDSNLDLFSFVAASRYANELVSDGFGGQEARFSCNVNLQGSMEAYTLINELAGVMRCFPIWSEGSVTITQDKPTDPSYLFSLANVGEGGFSYSGSSLKQRHTVISVSYFNMDSREIDYEVVEDTAAQAKLGIVKKDVKAFACTSRGQAQRLGKAILFSEQNESEVISFTTSIDAGAIVRPGSVISVNDPVRGGERRSGRINAATTTQITVDNTQDLDTFTGSNKKCSVILPDGTVETKNVTGIVGSVITLDSALSATPNVNAIWLLQSSTLEAQTFRVITVEEQDGINYAITALTYIDGKYANIESGISLPARSISLLNEPKSPPSNLQASERIVTINNLAVTKLILSWVSVTGVSQYLVQYRFNNTNWVNEVVFRPDFEIIGTEAGTYEFRVFSFNAALKLSATSSDLTFNAVGKTEPPANVQNLTMEPITNKLIRLRWDESVDPDVIHGGKVYVRHSNKTDGTGTFQNSVDLIEALAGNTTEAVCPSLEGEYILKFRDDQGNFSTGETSIILDLPDLIDSQQILEDKEHTSGFLGSKTNVSVVGGGLELTDPSVNLTGTYDFEDILDLGAVFSLNLKRLVQAIGFTVGAANTIDGLIPAGTLWDDYAQNGNFDGPEINDVSASMTVRSTISAPSGSSYANSDFANKPFSTFANGTFKGRGFQFRLNLRSESIAHNISIQQLSFLAAFESRTERSYISGNTTSTAPLTSSSSSSGLNVVFGSPFFTGATGLGGANAYLPSVGITIIGAEAGDYFVLSNVSGTGFNIKILDSSNNPVNPAKEFTFQAVGYGKGV